MSGIILNHNGYKVQYYDNMEEVMGYIQGVIGQYKHLNPQKIYDRTLDGNKMTRHKHSRIIRYRYDTLYEEVFIIDFN